MALEPTYLYKFVNGDQSWFYTNVGTEQVLGDDTYTTLLIKHTAPNISVDVSQANVTITVPFDTPVVMLYTPFIPPVDTLIFIYKGYLGVTDFELDWSGMLLRPEFDGGLANIMAQTTLASLNTEGLPETNQNLCNYLLGDGRCPVNLPAHRQPVAVTTITVSPTTGQVTLTVTGITQIDGWFTGGRAQALNGDFRFIVDHTGAVLTLDNPFPESTLAVSDVIDIFPGCDRLQSTCITKFGDETGDGDAFGGNPIVPKVNPHEYGRML